MLIVVRIHIDSHYRSNFSAHKIQSNISQINKSSVTRIKSIRLYTNKVVKCLWPKCSNKVAVTPLRFDREGIRSTRKTSRPRTAYVSDPWNLKNKMRYLDSLIFSPLFIVLLFWSLRKSFHCGQSVNDLLTSQQVSDNILVTALMTLLFLWLNYDSDNICSYIASQSV